MKKSRSCNTCMLFTDREVNIKCGRKNWDHVWKRRLETVFFLTIRLANSLNCVFITLIKLKLERTLLSMFSWEFIAQWKRKQSNYAKTGMTTRNVTILLSFCRHQLEEAVTCQVSSLKKYTGKIFLNNEYKWNGKQDHRSQRKFT